MIHRHRGNRRKTTYAKAARKRRLSFDIRGTDYHNIIGKYRDGKIHCSCDMCARKTGKNNWSASDQRKLDRMNCEIYI